MSERAGEDLDRHREALVIEGAREAAGDPVRDLLSRVRRAAAPPEPAASGGAWDVDRLASAIAAKAARLLGVPTVDVETDLFDAGASSVTAVELVAELARDLDVRLGLDDVFADARPRRLARLWLGAGGSGAGTAAPCSPGATRGSSATSTAAVAPAASTATAPATSTATAATAATAPTTSAATASATSAATAPPTSAASAPATWAAPDTDEDLSLIVADLARGDALPFVGAPEPAPPRRILLTGATGFLGSHLLVDLLRRGGAHVVCLVRADGDEQAERRLADALTGFHLPWSAELRRRVTVVAGDLGRPRLGLPEDRWQELARDVDAVVSVAAAVDFLRGYPSLRRTNVLGPLALAELAVTGTVKPLHHISSIAVFNEVGIASMGEDDPLARIDRLVSGYDKSKWAAEVALRRAREHGLTVTLMRPGGIAGHTRTGAYNPHDLSTGFTAAFTRFRTMPAFRALNVAPVDWVSRVASAIVHDPSAWGQTYNLTGRPGTLSEAVGDMRLSGMNVDVFGWDEWRADFLARMKDDRVPELAFLERVMNSPTALKLCEASLLGPAATAARTDAFVARHKLPPAVRYDARAQQRTVERMAESGLSRLPDRADEPYLWFPETMTGTLGPDDTACTLTMTLSIASMYQLVTERRIDVRQGEVRCARLHAEPLTVVDGDIWVRPEEGIPHRHGIQHPLLRYAVRLRDADGNMWWLNGRKTARPGRDLFKQATTLAVEIGREGEPAGLSGVVAVPRDSYLREQVDGIEVKAGLSARERRLAKLTWLAWFGSQIGQGLLEPALRAGAELLDLRRDRLKDPTR